MPPHLDVLADGVVGVQLVANLAVILPRHALSNGRLLRALTMPHPVRVHAGHTQD